MLQTIRRIATHVHGCSSVTAILTARANCQHRLRTSNAPEHITRCHIQCASDNTLWNRATIFSRFAHTIVRPPARNFANGLTTAHLGAPNVSLALAQHAAYCSALERNGCALIALPPDNRYPDSTFVEDTALILPERGAILTRPGAESRAGEVAAIRDVIDVHFPDSPEIVAPGTLDAGDVCEAGDRVFIGLSHRTNHEGARQLGDWLSSFGVASITVDIRDTPGILHLKSGVVAISEKTLVATDALADHPAFTEYEVLRVNKGDEYSANCVRVNDVIYVASGYPNMHEQLRKHGFRLEILDMSEFEKMDGGLSCLSLRFLHTRMIGLACMNYWSSACNALTRQMRRA